jgi:hypothetical protein
LPAAHRAWQNATPGAALRSPPTRGQHYSPLFWKEIR